jgi:hypothetical protein
MGDKDIANVATGGLIGYLTKKNLSVSQAKETGNGRRSYLVLGSGYNYYGL